MKFGLFAFLCGSGFLSVHAGNLTLSSSVSSDWWYTMHDNDVYLDNAGSVAYTLKDYSISSGEPWGGVTSSYNRITVAAGRDGSGKPSLFFLQGLGPANVMGNDVHSHQFPEELNFAIQGDLTMNVDALEVTCQDIRFGQGHNELRNNWWVGGPNCAGGNSNEEPVTCACNNGAHIKFQTGSDVYRFSVSLENKCAIISERGGSWVAVTAAAGTHGYSFSSSSEEYTEKDFTASLTADFSPPLEFGALEMSADAAYNYVTQSTTGTSWSKTCSVTVPEGKRLWQWVYTVETNCGLNSLNSCYFLFLPIDAGKPCCLAGFQSAVPKQCTEPGKNMCDGESPDVADFKPEDMADPRRLFQVHV